MHIIIYTHSDYFDILPIQLEYFRKNIEPHFYKISVFSNKLYPECCYDTYLYDDSLHYSSRITTCLKNIESDYIIILHENDVIIKYDKPMIDKLIESMKQNNITSLELKHDNRCSNHINITDTLLIGEKKFEYMFSVQPTIWRRDKLLELFTKFPNETYRTVENLSVQDYVRTNFKACILYTSRIIKTIWYNVDPCFVFLHLTSRLLLLPCTRNNNLNDYVQQEHEYIYNKYLKYNKRDIQPTLHSFLNYKVDEENLNSKK